MSNSVPFSLEVGRGADTIVVAVVLEGEVRSSGAVSAILVTAASIPFLKFGLVSATKMK